MTTIPLSINTIVAEEYSVTVPIPFGKLGSVINWCKYNCDEGWTYTPPPDKTGQDQYTFHFNQSYADYVAFALVYG